MSNQANGGDAYQHSRGRARRRPTWWLRRRDRQIVAKMPRPSDAELAELQAIRHELRIRAERPRPCRSWWA
jgi:hypothetical protein